MPQGTQAVNQDTDKRGRKADIDPQNGPRIEDPPPQKHGSQRFQLCSEGELPNAFLRQGQAHLQTDVTQPRICSVGRQAKNNIAVNGRHKGGVEDQRVGDQ